MARPPSTAGGRPHGVRVRFSDRELDALDKARGSLSRVDYLRSLIPGIKNPLTHTERRLQPPRGIEEVPLPGDPTPAPSTRHLHKFEQGEQVGYRQGEKVYRFTCNCGAVKEDTR